jgi:hypothetical protein
MSSGIFENGWIRVDWQFQLPFKDVNQNIWQRQRLSRIRSCWWKAIIHTSSLNKSGHLSWVIKALFKRRFECWYRLLHNKYTDFIGQVEMNVPKTDD